MDKVQGQTAGLRTNVVHPIFLPYCYEVAEGSYVR